MRAEINMLEMNDILPESGEIRRAGKAEVMLQAIVALSILFIMVLTCVDVVMRYVLASPVKGSAEMVQFAMALLIFAAFPLVTYHDKHITVSILHGRLHGRWEWGLRLVILLCNAAVCFAMGWELAREAQYLSTSGMATMVLGWPLGPLVYVMSALSVVSGLAALGLVRRHLQQFGHNRGRSA